jgi:MFS family permease
LPLASLGEIVGYRRVYLAGLLLFTLASAFCAVGFALCGALLSMLRLSPAGARGAEHVRVQEGQRMKGD